MPDLNMPHARTPKTHLVVGASRGIGLEFVRQLLARGDTVYAAARDVETLPTANFRSAFTGKLTVLPCDVTSEKSIKELVHALNARSSETASLHFDYVLVVAGTLRYPNRATELSFDNFELHLRTNTIGPIVVAQELLKAQDRGISVGCIMFMSSDSGSTACFREVEDGFAAYAASKAALNQALRHMAAELRRSGRDVIILAMHPGEVNTDMANIDLPWEIEGAISAEESVRLMIPVLESKNLADSGTFWTWQGEQYPW